MASIVPWLGVTPPHVIAEHNSILRAPPAAASRASPSDEQQTSIIRIVKKFLILVKVLIFSRFVALNEEFA